MGRRKVLVGNWKMNNTLAETKVFCSSLSEIEKSAVEKDVEIGIAPTYLAIAQVKEAAKTLKVYAEEVHYAPKGAYTGNISIPMIKELEVAGSLVGHSERRAYEGETNFNCNRKVRTLLANKMTPIYCVGETLVEFDSGLAKDVIKEQVISGLMNVEANDIKNVIIAYEPVWSIGTGKNASEEIANDVCTYIRDLIKEMYSKVEAEEIRILYGGSVKPNNIHGYLSFDNVDGALVGGASLTASSFAELIKNI